ncbi:oligosaccharyl transferase subunit ost3/OST6 [Malassezia brasiliensis]|uniref:Oligosaccharyl transferase subunit ost3/OST6 n=1 Tax=Malassezia brasiliensis TaxID=1821822 RepID=A0AAF0IQ60_9BASI|nr:oligosaccharyl transferase subunit ost3/OST6 [Malassezia brasiliensis]
MRLGTSLLCTVLCIVLLATQAVGNSVVQNNLLKEAKRSPNGVIELDETNYDLFLAAPRDFSVTVLYTALDSRFNCAACKMFMPSYEQVARGWQKKKSNKRHVFAVVEASRAMNVMRKNRFTHVPILYNFPVASGKTVADPSEFDVARQGFQPDSFADYMSDFLGVSFKPAKPLFDKVFLIQFFLVASAVSMGVLVIPRMNFANAGRAVWMMVCLALVFTFTSGYMWNRIRHPPFMLQRPNGDVQMFMEGFQTQTGVESPILIALYSGIALSIVMLNNLAPTIRSGPLQLVVVLACLAGLLGGFSVLMDTFRRKNPYYPFHLFV